MSSNTTPPPPPYSGHNPRRENQSGASSHSSSSSRSGRSHAHPAVESAVTRLLVAIKQLLESLTLWSTVQMTETQVSDVYVRLGNDFNAAVAAFAAFNIDMSDLMSVPEDLREILETCLAEEATQDNLQIYLPKVRQIITNLLQGLRGKQSMYRQIVSEHQHRHRSGQSSHSRTDSRSSRSDRTSRREGEPKHRSQLSRSNALEDGRTADRESTRQSVRSSTRRQEVQASQSTPHSVFEEPDDDGPVHDSNNGNTNGVPERSSMSAQSQRSERAPAAVSNHPPFGESSARGSTETLVPSIDAATTQQSDQNNAPPSTPPQPANSAVPASVKRYSLVDRPVASPPPMSPPAVIINEPPPLTHEYVNGADQADASTPPETPLPDTIPTPAAASSLAALQKHDQLERRASKRFSVYNIAKMTGSGAMRERSTRGNNANRRSMAASSTLTPGELAVLTEAEEPSQDDSRLGGVLKTQRSSSRTPSPIAVHSQEPTPPVPPLPSLLSSEQPRSQPEPRQSIQERTIIEEPPETPSSAVPRTISVFLQIGREVKKAAIEPGLTFSSLRVLFVDKFSYNPGLENFPAIYIRDPSSGVQYELEDIDEVKDKCLLSLNIEPLDQIKQHIDAQISTLSNDLKELKTAVSSNRRSSYMAPIVAHDFAESTPMADRPSDKHFQHVARRLSRIVGDGHSPFIIPQMTGQSLQLQPQMTGASIASEYSSRVVNDLKTQFDEVQNLRRDLATMRQLYTEFMGSTKESLATLRTQTQNVKQLATAKVGGARGYIDSGKTNLDSRSQNVLTKVEELQDTVEALKEDVVKRQVTPKLNVLKAIQNDVATTAAELASLKEHIDTIKPMWKKTWEEELQNIVEEQGFLGHQEEFLSDLLEDHKAVIEVMGHVEKVISIRGSAPGRPSRNRGFKPPPADEGHSGLSTVMMEIRGAAVDPERRMKAIAANQKNRERELASRSDEFQEELTGFVSGKKLKMTGGAEEVERVRQKRNDLALKAMFNNVPTPPGEGRMLSPSSPNFE
ncbi:actin interacting protein 3-domain-containing protein [Hygrophoropsis aurantiaca]|uniref:Actin interacting protein 3-domain-containing protein n=1 Tax=Hygrophoropsis aurantiaca TaxID=72124 RepID=A0ACB8AI64_9AGAM|nr:actin interacting protein 3-domain-containing protein [Hygrophoropsis aurantiaca]